MRRLLLVSLLAAGGCSQAPRSASYFEAHPDEAAQVVADCARGAHRGRECETALAAKNARDAKARKDLFRRGFE